MSPTLASSFSVVSAAAGAGGVASDMAAILVVTSGLAGLTSVAVEIEASGVAAILTGGVGNSKG